MTVVDVNTGKFTGSGGNLEETVTKNNLEAAEEIVRQLRLRDIGGIIVVDFIDMVLESNRDLVLRRLVECLGRDRTRHQVAEVTSLGLVQMTRKRIGTGLLEAFSETCAHCQGRGLVIHDAPGRAEGAPTTTARRGGGAGGRRSRGGRGRGSRQRRRRRRQRQRRNGAKAPVAQGRRRDGPAAGRTSPTSDARGRRATPTDAEDEPSDEPSRPSRPSRRLDRSRRRSTPERDRRSRAPRPSREPEPRAAEPEPAPEPAAGAGEAHRRSPGPAAAAPSRPAGPPEARRRRRRPTARSQPAVGSAATTAEAPRPARTPHVEHVPIKRKGSRKR